MACQLSAFQGGRRLGAARALWFDLPQTFAALTAGALSERVAEAVVHETRHLDHDLRQQVDQQVIAAGITEMGIWAATACAKKYAYEADRAGYVERGRTERKQRRVTLRPAPDTMSFLTGHLPVEQGVACLAALKLHTDALKAVGDARTRGQIMADTLVERITGQATATDVNVEVQIVLPAELLTDPASNRTAIVQGYGPIPGQLATQIIDASQGRKTWRKVTTRSSYGSPNVAARKPEPPSLMEARIIDLFTSRGGRRREVVGSASGCAASPESSPSWSDSETRPAGCRIATPRSATWTTSSNTATVGRPPSPMARASANGTTTCAACRAGVPISSTADSAARPTRP